MQQVLVAPDLQIRELIIQLQKKAQLINGLIEMVKIWGNWAVIALHHVYLPLTSEKDIGDSG